MSGLDAASTTSFPAPVSPTERLRQSVRGTALDEQPMARFLRKNCSAADKRRFFGSKRRRDMKARLLAKAERDEAEGLFTMLCLRPGARVRAISAKAAAIKEEVAERRGARRAQRRGRRQARRFMRDDLRAEALDDGKAKDDRRKAGKELFVGTVGRLDIRECWMRDCAREAKLWRSALEPLRNELSVQEDYDATLEIALRRREDERRARDAETHAFLETDSEYGRQQRSAERRATDAFRGVVARSAATAGDAAARCRAVERHAARRGEALQAAAKSLTFDQRTRAHHAILAVEDDLCHMQVTARCLSNEARRLKAFSIAKGYRPDAEEAEAGGGEDEEEAVEAVHAEAEVEPASAGAEREPGSGMT